MRKWFLIAFVLFVVMPLLYYIKYRDWIGEEKDVRYKKYNSLNINASQQYKKWGIDVSKHNGEINWAQIAKAQIDTNTLEFVYIKATEGYWYIDPQFLDNWYSARAVGIKRGAYHFFRPRWNPRFQAWLFKIMVSQKEGDLPPVLDIESDEGLSDEEVTAAAKKWLQLVENQHGIKPMIYTNLNYYNRIVKGKLDDYPLWIAQYRGEKPNLPDSVAWKFWQMSDKATINGINEKVDINVVNFQ
jgi:lysozyme